MTTARRLHYDYADYLAALETDLDFADFARFLGRFGDGLLHACAVVPDSDKWSETCSIARLSQRAARDLAAAILAG